MKRSKTLVFFIFFIAVASLCGCNNQKNRLEDYFQTIEDIRSSFNYEGFEEVMQDKTCFLALPMEYSAISKADYFLGGQKLFVYKSHDQGVIIMLQVTFNESLNNQWSSSVDYNSQTFNSPNSQFGDFYNEDIPDIEVASNSFAYKECNFNTLCISGKSDSSLAATVLVNFSNKLIEYLTD